MLNRDRTIQDLPDEILLKILEYVTPEFLFLVAMRVDSQWYAMASDNQLWENKYSRHFPDTKKNLGTIATTWKAAFITTYSKTYAQKKYSLSFSLNHQIQEITIRPSIIASCFNENMLDDLNNLSFPNNPWSTSQTEFSWFNKDIGDKSYFSLAVKLNNPALYKFLFNTCQSDLLNKAGAAIVCKQPFDVIRKCISDATPFYVIDIFRTVQWLDRKIDVFDADKPLFLLAASYGRLDVVWYLLEKYPHLLNQQDQYGQTALLWAAALGNTDMLEYLLTKENIELDHATSTNGYTALHWAVSRGETKAVGMLITAGASIDFNEAHDLGLLHLAIDKNHLDIIQILVKKTDILFQTNNKKQTPLVYAIVESCNIICLSDKFHLPIKIIAEAEFAHRRSIEDRHPDLLFLTRFNPDQYTATLLHSPEKYALKLMELIFSSFHTSSFPIFQVRVLNYFLVIFPELIIDFLIASKIQTYHLDFLIAKLTAFLEKASKEEINRLIDKAFELTWPYYVIIQILSVISKFYPSYIRYIISKGLENQDLPIDVLVGLLSNLEELLHHLQSYEENAIDIAKKLLIDINTSHILTNDHKQKYIQTIHHVFPELLISTLEWSLTRPRNGLAIETFISNNIDFYTDALLSIEIDDIERLWNKIINSHNDSALIFSLLLPILNHYHEFIIKTLEWSYNHSFSNAILKFIIKDDELYTKGLLAANQQELDTLYHTLLNNAFDADTFILLLIPMIRIRPKMLMGVLTWALKADCSELIDCLVTKEYELCELGLVDQDKDEIRSLLTSILHSKIDHALKVKLIAITFKLHPALIADLIDLMIQTDLKLFALTIKNLPSLQKTEFNDQFFNFIFKAYDENTIIYSLDIIASIIPELFSFKDSCGRNLFLLAYQANNFEVAEWLAYSHHLDPNFDENNESLLIRAIELQDANRVMCLLSARANLYCVSNTYQPAIHLAAQYGNDYIIALLIASNRDLLTLTNADLHTPALTAAINGNVAALKELLSYTSPRDEKIQTLNNLLLYICDRSQDLRSFQHKNRLFAKSRDVALQGAIHLWLTAQQDGPLDKDALKEYKEAFKAGKLLTLYKALAKACKNQHLASLKKSV